MNEESKLDAMILGRMEARVLTDSQKSDLLVRCAAAIFVWPGLGETLEDLMADPTVGMIVGTTQAADQMFGFQEGELLFKNVEVLMPERFRKRHRDHLISFILNPMPRQMGSRLEGGAALYGLHRTSGEFPLEIGLQQRMSGKQKCIVAQPAVARLDGTHS